jgi:hypothetical protein
MSASARGELARARSLDYARAGRKARTSMLDEFIASTGVNRKTAIVLLSNPPSAKGRPRGRRKKRYGVDVAAAVELLWATTGYVCSKRLAPFLSELAAMVQEAGEWGFSDSVMVKLGSISASTCERLLRPHKASRRMKGRSMTKPGSMLKAQIPVRTWADWSEKEPGYCEMDLVHHCDDDTSGEYLHTLTITDVATCWTEILALKNRSQFVVECGTASMVCRIVKGCCSQAPWNSRFRLPRTRQSVHQYLQMTFVGFVDFERYFQQKALVPVEVPIRPSEILHQVVNGACHIQLAVRVRTPVAAGVQQGGHGMEGGDVMFRQVDLKWVHRVHSQLRS